jgi:hypothetical protein
VIVLRLGSRLDSVELGCEKIKQRGNLDSVLLRDVGVLYRLMPKCLSIQPKVAFEAREECSNSV